MEILMKMNILVISIIAAVLFIFFNGVRIVRPTQRGLIDSFSKYRKFANPSFHWIISVIDRLFAVNITEQMVDAEPQEIITNDNLNASVDALVYFKVMEEEENVKNFAILCKRLRIADNKN
jgi:regulator of protease activity HflC (stomatin/prohibitin superfamily)